MKKISLAKVTDEQLDEMIKEVEGRATARTITAKRIREILADVQQKVPTKKALEQTKVVYTGAEKFPNAYKYTPESTHFSAEFLHGAWVITDIYRTTCPNRYANINVTYSESAKAAIIEALSAYTA